MSKNTQETLRRIGPEDLRRGQHVVITSELSEWTPIFSCVPRAETPNTTRWRNERPEPLLVRDVCLPLVLVRDPKGEHRVLNLQMQEIALCADKFGRAAYEALALKKTKKKKKKKKKKSGK